MASIYAKLLSIQKDLKAPKGQYNEFGKFYYRNCEDIQEALKPLTVREGITLVVNDEIVQIGNRFYVKATATLIDIETGDKVENTAYAREDESKKGMDGSQLTGATSSYARKYALNGLFCIDDSKDADTPQQSNLSKDDLIKEFQEEIKRTQKSVLWFLKNVGVNNVEEMQMSDLEEAIKALRQCPTKKQEKPTKAKE